MKRYIFFIGTLGSGGAERVVSILSGKMAEKGLNTEVLTYYDYPVFYEMHPAVKVTAVEKESGKTSKISNFFWIRNYFKKNAKVVISFLAPFNVMAIAAKLGKGIPMIVADRNDPTKVPTNAVVRKLRDFLYMFADGVVLQTEKNKAYFNRVVQKKSTIIYNPIDLKDYAGIALNSKKERMIVSAGRLMKQKNQKLMINAFASVLKSYPDYKLVIYGEGPCKKELEEQIKQLDISENVLLPGSTTELHDKIKSADIFVLSSDYEGMPNALIEAMCLGIPVISTKVSGATDLIQHRENGLLVEIDDEDELRHAMLELLENKDKARRMAEKATELNEALEVSKIMEQWIHFIQLKCQ